MRTMRHLIYIAACVATMMAPAAFGGAYYLTTGQSNANTTIDTTHEMQWVASAGQNCPATVICQTFVVGAFTPSFSWDLGGGIFTIKDGTHTVDDIFLNFYDVTNAVPDTLTGATLLGTVDVSSSSVTSSYAPVDFFFDIPITLQVGEEYVATLTSTTPTPGSDQYFIKGIDALSIQNSQSGGGTPLTDPTSTPEPSTWATVAGGLLLTLWAGSKRASRAF